MAVFDVAGRQLGRVEDLHGGHFFLTRALLVTERIVVDAAASVAYVDDRGVHLRSDREDLLTRRTRPPETKSSRQVAPGEDAASIRRGDEDRRQLDADDARPHEKAAHGPHPGSVGPTD
ncbi:MAG: hypothetical protein ACXWLG_13145 [Myxococcaceae bacterium]